MGVSAWRARARCSGASRAVAVRQLVALRLPHRDLQLAGQPLGERAAAEREHPGRLDAAVAHQRDVGGAAADVDEDGAARLDVLGVAAARQRVRLGDGGDHLEVELLGDGLQRADVVQRREGVEDGDVHNVALEVDRVAHRVAVDAHRGDGAVHQLDVDLGDAELVRHLAHRLLERAPLHGLQRGGEVRLGDPRLRLRAGHGHRGAEAAHLLAGDAHDRLAGDHLAHVLGLGEGAVAVVDHRLDVGDRAALHVGELLADARGADDDALVVLALDHQRLDELGADVEHRVMGVELGAAAQQRELALAHPAGPRGLAADRLADQRAAPARVARVLDRTLGEVGAAAAAAAHDLGGGADEVAGAQPGPLRGGADLDREGRAADHDGDAVGTELLGEEPVGDVDDRRWGPSSPSRRSDA